MFVCSLVVGLVFVFVCFAGLIAACLALVVDGLEVCWCGICALFEFCLWCLFWLEWCYVLLGCVSGLWDCDACAFVV